LKSDDQLNKLNPATIQAVFQANTEEQPEFLLFTGGRSGWNSGQDGKSA
jgi:hypothetical protein